MEGVRPVSYFVSNSNPIPMHHGTQIISLNFFFLALIVYTRSNWTASVKAQIALISTDNTQSLETVLLSFSLSLDVS